VTVVIRGGRIGNFELVFKLDVVGVLRVLIILVWEEFRVKVVVVVDLVVLALLHEFGGYLGKDVGRGGIVVVDVDGVYVLLNGLSRIVNFHLLRFFFLWHLLAVEQVGS
jgi:hypothetical protein